MIFSGEPGSGKTCSMVMLAMDWAEGKAPTELQQFDFVFLIALKNVNKNIPLEEIILQQHGRMKTMGASREQIKKFIREKRTLIMFDGYDEYQRGTNLDIDNAISDSLGSCFLLVTFRPGDYMKKPDRDQMDGELRITGFSYVAIEECAAKYLGSKQGSDDLLTKCNESILFQSNYKAEIQKGHKRYLVARTYGEQVLLKDSESDVLLKVSNGVKAVVFQRTWSDWSDFELIRKVI